MADVVLSITIKDEHKLRVLAALTEYAEKEIAYVIRKDNPVSDVWQFSYSPQGADAPKLFAEKVIKKMILELTRCYEYNLDRIRLETEIQNLIPATESVPENIME